MWSRADGHFLCSELDEKLFTILEKPITGSDASRCLSRHTMHLCHRDSLSGPSVYHFTVSSRMLRPEHLPFEIHIVLFYNKEKPVRYVLCCSWHTPKWGLKQHFCSLRNMVHETTCLPSGRGKVALRWGKKLCYKFWCLEP